MELKFRTLNANEIECRVAMIKSKGLQLLLYKDARVDQNLLDEVVAIMGKPTVEFSDDVYEHSILTTATYQTDDCVMTITFFTDTAAEKGFVVGLTWNPVVVNNTLSMQEGYDTFYSGLYSKLDFSDMTESVDEDSNSHDSEDSVISE